MKAYKTAALTAVWRHMGKVDSKGLQFVDFKERSIATLLGMCDLNSVKTITKRTKLIDDLIRKHNPETVVEIGAGYSTRSKRFESRNFVNLDVKEIAQRKQDVIAYNIPSPINLDIKNAFFIIEGVSMYLEPELVRKLLEEIKEYKGVVAIDFFLKTKSRKFKPLKEKLYRKILKSYIGREHLFNYTFDDVSDAKEFLEELKFKNVQFHPYYSHSLDALFSAEL